jgi:hypothetical protein
MTMLPPFLGFGEQLPAIFGDAVLRLFDDTRIPSRGSDQTPVAFEITFLARSGHLFQQLVNPRFRSHSLGDNRIDKPAAEAMLDPLVHAIADENLGVVLLV